MRILGLHGDDGSAASLRGQAAHLIANDAELVCVDAPTLAAGHVIPADAGARAATPERLHAMARGRASRLAWLGQHWP